MAPPLRAPLARLRELPDFFDADFLPAADLLEEVDLRPVRDLLLALLLRPPPLRAEDLLACLSPVFFALFLAEEDFFAEDFFAEDFFAEDFLAPPCLRPLPDFLPP